jgi:hypothetical protein
VAFRASAALAAEQSDQSIARVDRADRRAWLISAARSVHLPRSNARDAQLRAFGAPHRPVTIPNGCRRAAEGLTGRNDRGWRIRRRKEIRADDGDRDFGQEAHRLISEPHARANLIEAKAVSRLRSACI